jgi:hypothetical protein
VAAFIVASALAPAAVSAASGSAPDPSWTASKSMMATEWSDFRLGHVSSEKYVADAIAFEKRWSKFHAGAPRPKAAGASAGISSAQAAPNSMYSDNTLYPFSQFPESPTWYCGPAATQSILTYLTIYKLHNSTTNSHDGEALTQPCLAGTCGSGAPYSWKYLETNHWGSLKGTPWWSGGTDWPVPESLNYWLWGNYNVFYAAYKPTSLSDYEAKFTYDIDSFYPVAADVEEIAGGTHLLNHPQNKEIEHWIALDSYGSYGGLTSYVDPVAGSALNWNPMPPAQVWSFDSGMMYTMLTDSGPNGGPYGIAW